MISSRKERKEKKILKKCFSNTQYQRNREDFFFFFFFFFCLFVFSRVVPKAYGGSQARGLWPTPQTKQHGIWAMSATYTTAHSNARSLTHWGRPGIKPTTSWFLVGFINNWATMVTPWRTSLNTLLKFPIQKVWDEAGNFAFLTSSLMSLVWRPDFENHCYKKICQIQ